MVWIVAQPSATAAKAMDSPTRRRPGAVQREEQSHQRRRRGNERHQEDDRLRLTRVARIGLEINCL